MTWQRDAATLTEGGYRLNFDNADIKDVLHAVLSGVLGISYSVAPNVTGRLVIAIVSSFSRRCGRLGVMVMTLSSHRVPTSCSVIVNCSYLRSTLQAQGKAVDKATWFAG